MRTLALTLLFATACGTYADSPATPPTLNGVRATRIVNGNRLCVEPTSGDVVCIEASDPSAPAEAHPELDGTTAVGHDEACGLSAEGTVTCGEFVWPQQHVAAAAVATSAMFWLDGSGGLHCASEQNDNNRDIDLGGAKATAVAATDYEVCALLEGGTVRCWAYDTFSEKSDTPVCLVHGAGTDVTNLGNVRQLVVAGSWTYDSNDAMTPVTTHCVLTGGNVKCWGDNVYGQAGGPGALAVAEPTLVADAQGHALHEVVQIDLVIGRGCAVIRDGDLDCWGTDLSGSTAHAAIGFGKNVKQVSLGVVRDAAVMSDGSVVVWGGTHQVGPTIDLGINPPTY